MCQGAQHTCMLIAVGVVCVKSSTMKKSGSGAAKTRHRCAKTTIPVPAAFPDVSALIG